MRAAALRELESEQEEAYTRAREELASKEGHLRSAISDVEAQQSVTTVQF